MNGKRTARTLLLGLAVAVMFGCAQTEGAREQTAPEERTVSTENDAIAGRATGTISVVTREDMGRRSARDVAEMIEGRVAGLSVIRTSRGTGFQIRGQNSIQSTSFALIVLDGMPMGTNLSTLAFLNPNDVDRVEVLKGSSAAYYGSRGGNGVVVITTKH